MRKKLFVGTFLVGIVGIIAGEYLFSRSKAQDGSTKGDSAEKKVDLDEILKKALEPKKDVALPPLHTPGSAQIPGPGSIPPPSEVQKPATLPGPLPLPPVTNVKPPLADEPKKKDELPAPLPLPSQPKDGPPAFPPLTVQPKESNPAPLPPLTTQPKDDLPPIKPAPNGGTVIPPPKGPTPSIPNLATHPEMDTKPARPLIAEEIAKIKNCPWSLQIDLVDGKTVVVATVHKKHAFKIVCQSLDLQTGKGTLHAAGNVQITGEALTGSCDMLSIPLLDDRLVLDGKASITIEKDSAKVSDSPSTAFELKGERLTLQINQLTSGKYVQTSMRKLAIDVNVKQASGARAAAINDKQWTSYGTLRRIDNRTTPADESVWCLEDARGNVIAYLVARSGGSLSQYEGQRISVYGTAEQIGNDAYLRVSHIALPR
ncbi:MAG: hypothetical protein HYR84_16710 [Planctomycetes bacterium]|nr:hypothetical protein [Planctomycetota bacterium]